MPTIEAVLAITLWGISFISIKIALEEVSPVTLIIIRFSIGAFIVGITAWMRGEWRSLRTTKGRDASLTCLSSAKERIQSTTQSAETPTLTARDLPSLALVGLVGITLQQFLQVSGQALAEASVAGLLAASAPAFTLLLAAVILQERQGWRQIFGVLLAMLGSFLVVTNGQPGAINISDFHTQGSLLVLSSAIVWGLFTIMTRKVVQGKPAIAVTSSMFLFGTIFALPIFIYQKGWQELADVSTSGWVSILFTAILCTGAAYLLNTHSLKFIPASKVAAIQMLEPVVVIIAAAVILGEALSLPVAIGGLAILGGVFLAQQLPGSS